MISSSVRDETDREAAYDVMELLAAGAEGDAAECDWRRQALLPLSPDRPDHRGYGHEKRRDREHHLRFENDHNRASDLLKAAICSHIVRCRKVISQCSEVWSRSLS